jgi:hypothetical protein
MICRASLRLALGLCIAACGDDPTGPQPSGFRITSREPSAGASAVPLTRPIIATFSAPVDPATLTPTSVVLTLKGALVPVQYSYDEASRQIRTLAPLLPGSTYRVELDRALRSQDGDSLGESAGWSFATRPWQPVTISVIGELSGFDMEVGTGGSIHLVGEGEAFLREGDDFPDTYVKFVTCAADCTTPGNWSRVAIDSAWAAGSGMGLEQDESGTLHLIHISESPAPIPDTGHPVVRYGTCSADCAVLSNWSMATVDSATVIYDYGYFASFTVTAGGTVHLLTLSSLGGPPDLTYATCAAQCTVAANWSRAVIPVTGYPMGWSALQADPSGRLHLLTELDQILTYSTCAGDCTSPGQWSSGPVQPSGMKALSASYTFDVGGRIHMVFSDPSYAFSYAVCEAACTQPTSWTTVRLDRGDRLGSGIVVASDGRITVLNPIASPGELRLLVCAFGCLDAANWQIAAVEQPDIFGLPTPGAPRFAPGPSGGIRMVYGDMSRTLHYLE